MEWFWGSVGANCRREIHLTWRPWDETVVVQRALVASSPDISADCALRARLRNKPGPDFTELLCCGSRRAEIVTGAKQQEEPHWTWEVVGVAGWGRGQEAGLGDIGQLSGRHLLETWT